MTETAIADLPHSTTDGLQLRSARRFSAIPRPFLKWAGSKQAILPELLDILPPAFDTYFEPFLGSAALFFCLKPPKAILNDKCLDLIETYKSLRDNPAEIMRYLRSFRTTKRAYYSIRENQSTARLKRAAQFIYLNKLCWNGLYRVNSSGQFNVPYGAPKTRNIFDSKNIRACAKALQQRIMFHSQDFDFVLQIAKKGDFVFFDPPYVTKHNNNGFRDWNETLFSWKDQERLAETALALKCSGVHVLVCNADHDDIIALYPNFNVKRIVRSTTLASNAQFRGKVTEIVLHSTKRLPVRGVANGRNRQAN
jgi:DNA adenine methylase